MQTNRGNERQFIYIDSIKARSGKAFVTRIYPLLNMRFTILSLRVWARYQCAENSVGSLG